MNNELEVRLYKSIDPVTGSQKVISKDELSQGYSISGTITPVADTATTNYAFKTPASGGKIIRLKAIEVKATANKIRCDLYEAPTNAPTNGTTLTPYNHNRSGAASTMQVCKSAMDLDLTGVTLVETSSFVIAAERTYILKPNTWYIRTFTNLTGADASISFYEFWYEE